MKNTHPAHHFSDLKSDATAQFWLVNGYFLGTLATMFAVALGLWSRSLDDPRRPMPPAKAAAPTPQVPGRPLVNNPPTPRVPGRPAVANPPTPQIPGRPAVANRPTESPAFE